MRDTIMELMKRVFKLDCICEDISTKNCVEWDSMNHLHLVYELEMAFDIMFLPEDVSRLTSLLAIETILTDEKKLTKIIDKFF